MPVNIKTEDAAETERLAERASLVDELYELSEWLVKAGVAEKLKRIEAIKQALVADANATWNDRAVARVLEGTVANATISAASCKREVTDPKAVLAHLVASLGQEQGEAAFWEGITVPLGFVDKYLSPEEQKGIVDEAYTGSRTTKVAKRAG